MKLAPCLTALALASCAALPATRSEETSIASKDNRIAVYLGGRSLDEDDYSPVEDQAVFGVEFAHERAGSAIGFEIGLMGSYADDDSTGLDIEGSTGELYGGVRKSFGSGVVRPHIGGGLSFINSEIRVTGAGSDDDRSAAGYVHGGVLFDVSQSFFLGVDLRVLFGSDLQIAGVDTDADYSQFALVLGFSL